MIEEKYLKNFNGRKGISEDEITDLKLPNNIPSDYLDFIRLYNGGEGFIGQEYLILYSAEELVEMNANYEVEKYVPGIFLIGSNGGDEAIAFDLRGVEPKVIIIPFLFEPSAIVALGNNMNEFFKQVYEKGYFE